MDTVSCLLVTQECRQQLVVGAVRSFRAQSYKPLELVIVYSGADHYGEFLRELTNQLDAKVFCIPGSATLGAARNLSIAKASGEIYCQWDDDDEYGRDRVSAQLAAMGNAAACFLDDQYYFFRPTRELYIRKGSKIPGTVMFRKDSGCRYPENGACASKGEDWVFFECLRKYHKIVAVPGRPELYLRHFHGSNTWDEQHHRGNLWQAESATLLQQQKDKIVRDVRAFGLTGVRVMGKDGKAFDA